MGVDETLLNEVVRRVLRVARPERIILFGFAAAGRMNCDSDIDLLVLESTPWNPRNESVRIGDALRGLGFPFDAIVMDIDFDFRGDNLRRNFDNVAFPRLPNPDHVRRSPRHDAAFHMCEISLPDLVKG